MSVNDTRPSLWTFPKPALEVDLPASSFDTVEFNNSMIGFLRQSAKDPPAYSIGSDNVVYNGDTIELAWSGLDDATPIEHWCLACTERYSGKSGWGACEDFTNTTTTSLYHENIGEKKYQPFSYIPSSFKPDVFVAICAFGLAADPFDLTVAYPFINTEREDGTVLTFSSDRPLGFEAPSSQKIPPSQKISSVSPSRTAGASSTDLFPWIFLLPSTYVAPHYTPPPRPKSHAGTIAGALIGAVTGTFLLFALLVCMRKQSVVARSKAQRQSVYKSRAQDGRDGFTDAVPLGTEPRPPPRPFVRDRLSRGTDTDTDEPPPPAYEEIVVGTARDAEGREWSEHEQESSEMARDRPADSGASRI